ncbi:MAG: hypothetical protein JWN80_2132 [Microbacteriaceae bacterium]|nr:hypothetical protein [Microbacteriaceae bacterium]
MKLIAPLVVVALAIGVIGAPAAASATSEPWARTAAGPTATVAFAATDDGIVTPGSDLIVTGTIANTSDDDLLAGTATVYLTRGAVSTRADFSSWLDSTDSVATDKLGDAVATVATPSVAAGKSANVTIQVPAAAVGIASDAAWGARKLAVEVTDGTSQIGQSRSSIVWNSTATYTPVALALAMPLTVPTPTTGLIPAATLATYTAANGILTRQLDEAIDRHIAIGLDPMIITSIRILGTTVPPTAQAWLDRLSAATNEVFPLTYADSDVSAMSQAGLATVLAPTSLSIDPRLFPGYTIPPTASPTTTPIPNPTATAAPAVPTLETIAQWTYTPALAGLVWPANNTVTEPDLDWFKAKGYTTTILGSGNVNYPDLEYTPGSRATVDKQSAVVSDSDISREFQAAASATTDANWQLAIANFSSTLAVVANQRSAAARTLLATLDRAAPDSDLRLAQTMQAMAAMPWTGFSRLADVVDAPPVVTATLASQTESGTRLAEIKAMLSSESSVASFSSILTDPTVLTGERRLSLLAAMANTWNSQGSTWPPVIDKYTAASAKTLKSVNIAQTGTQALLSDTVNLGVAVTNDLAWPVNVLVGVRSPTGVIEVEKSHVPLTVEANSQAKASVPVKALANGNNIVLHASLTSATGVRIGSSTSLTVNVQAGWESAITGIFAGIVIAVFGVGIYRNIAKRRKRKTQDPDAAPATEGDAE